MSEPIHRHHTNARMSKIVRHRGLIYLCGQTAAGSAATDITEQTKEVLSRVDTLLGEASSDRTHLISAVIHLRSMADFTAMNVAWEAWIPQGMAPARTTVEARLAWPGLLVEITAIAAEA